jgi:L-asparaginase II
VLVEIVRSGLVESVHDGAVAIVDASGRVTHWYGEIDRVFYLRSASKPFQATASQELGADLVPEQMALACASHRGRPAHVAIVTGMLAEVGLSEDDLACPPDWPAARDERDRVIAAGHREPRPVWHNCSGKHAAMLRACVAKGWPTDGYTDPDHPLQQRVFATMRDVLGHDPGPVGVDGCGVPVHRGSVHSLASAYSRLGTDPRFSEAWTAMHRFPTLTQDQGTVPAMIGTWLNAAAKGGDEGSCGVSILGQAGVALKAWDGASRAVGPAIVEALRQAGYVFDAALSRLEKVRTPPVYGGGLPVGSARPVLRLRENPP